MKEPQAKKIPKKLEKFGYIRWDDFFWMRERESRDVLQYLNQENKYASYLMKPYEKIQSKIFKELKSLQAPEHLGSPYWKTLYQYYMKFQKGRDYPVFVRKAAQSGRQKRGGREEILIDGPKLAKGKKYFQLGAVCVSPDEKKIAYLVDTVGRRQYQLCLFFIETGKTLKSSLKDLSTDLEWSSKSDEVLVVQKHSETLRPYRVFQIKAVARKLEAALSYEESDEEYYVGLGKTSDQDLLYLYIYKTLTTEIRFQKSDLAHNSWTLFWPRESGHSYSLDSHAGRFWIRSNRENPDFQLFSTDVHPVNFNPKRWKLELNLSENYYFSGFHWTQNQLLIQYTHLGLLGIAMYRMDKNLDWKIVPGPWDVPADKTSSNSSAESSKQSLQIRQLVPQPVLSQELDGLVDPKSAYFQYFREGPVQPLELIRVHWNSKKQVWTEKKIWSRQVPGFHPRRYASQRQWVKVRDGTLVPVTLVWKPAGKPTQKLTRNPKAVRSVATLDSLARPALLYGYGSYGLSLYPDFYANIVPLLDRGFLYVQVHVRGGQELGRKWYEQGRLQSKMNSFFDFIDVAKDLSQPGSLVDAKRMYAQGGSAGGLLMGATMNLEPELFSGVISEVPFVDVLTTMLDASIPLTTAEYSEWGNPNHEADYLYIRKYSPLDNVGEFKYPPLLVLSGYHDSQVQYWEPTKWVAKLRNLRANKQEFLALKTEMHAGHGGASGRYKALEDVALKWAFLVGLSQK